MLISKGIKGVCKRVKCWFSINIRDSIDFKQPMLFRRCDDIMKWRAFEKWKIDNLTSLYGERLFEVSSDDYGMESTVMKLSDFVEKMRSVTSSNLYLFDSSFDYDCPELCHDYTVPEVFQDDVISRLPSQLQPDYKWFIIGGSRSGSRLHIDPILTNAWNALIHGDKEWVLIEPFPDYVNFKSQAKTLADHFNIEIIALIDEIRNCYPSIRIHRFFQSPGDLVFVPKGWLHAVRNRNETVAITHNFVQLSCKDEFLEAYATSKRLSVLELDQCRLALQKRIR